MRKIVLDTNFLINCAKFKIDFFSEIERICTFTYKLSVTEATLNELDRLKPKQLKLIKALLSKVDKIPSENNYADTQLIQLSKEGAIIATQDQLLKKQLTKPYIIIRQKKYLNLID